MKVKCEYCSSMIDDTSDKCPYCGGINKNIRRTVNGTPKTIEELKLWYRQRNLPPEDVTRFFIGKDYKGARAFGIYRDGDKVVVYKNKSDGSRAIRYEGTDEAYAVNELYLKLKSEILNQKSRNAGKGSGIKGTPGGFVKSAVFGGFVSFFGNVLLFLFVVAAIVIPSFASLKVKSYFFAAILGVIFAFIAYILIYHSEFMKRVREKIKAGWLVLVAMALVFTLLFSIPIKAYMVPKYYRFQEHTYVSYHDKWYEYDGIDDYERVYPGDFLPVEIVTHPADYEYDMSGADWDNSITAFEFSDYYSDNFSSSSGGSDYSNSDSDYDWDSGSDWDSGGTDWDSDW